jgi:cell division protein FtsB
MADEPQDIIDRLRDELCAQIRELYEQIAQLRQELLALKQRNERLESISRRL